MNLLDLIKKYSAALTFVLLTTVLIAAGLLYNSPRWESEEAARQRAAEQLAILESLSEKYREADPEETEAEGTEAEGTADGTEDFYGPTLGTETEESSTADSDESSSGEGLTDPESMEETTESEEPTEDTTAAPSTKKETKKETAKATTAPTTKKATSAPPSSSPKYEIIVNKKYNYVLIMKDGAAYHAYICSTGGSNTPEGVFKTSDKYKWRALFGNVWGQYATRIVDHILFHSVPYEKENNPASLETAEYNKLGTSASAGCVRMTVAACKWIYENIPKGTKVTITSADTPCPIAVEGATKIPSDCKWDPTDPNKNNPWYGYEAPQPTIEPIETPAESIVNDSTEAASETESAAETESATETESAAE